MPPAEIVAPADEYDSRFRDRVRSVVPVMFASVSPNRAAGA
jgi:hypothetical protein